MTKGLILKIITKKELEASCDPALRQATEKLGN